jgi:undecaprenyl-diphosphatase
MTVWEAIGLGVVQGLTEFLPISSTAHLIAVRTAWGHEHPEDAFTTVIQLGTLFAVLLYFRQDLYHILIGTLRDLRMGELGRAPDSRLAGLILLASLPAGIAGLLGKRLLNEQFKSLEVMGIVAIVFALLMALAEWWARRRPPTEPALPGQHPSISMSVALWIGFWQMLALMPGASRSGCTLTGGLFAGLTRSEAARFSFLMSLPIILAAGLKEFWDDRNRILQPQGEAFPLLIGLVVSAVVGWASIWGLLRFLQRYRMDLFILYRLGFGVALILAANR